jgi:hypothetical protein
MLSMDDFGNDIATRPLTPFEAKLLKRKKIFDGSTERLRLAIFSLEASLAFGQLSDLAILLREEAAALREILDQLNRPCGPSSKSAGADQ